MKRVKQSFLTGLAVIVPFLITAYVVQATFGLLDGWIHRFGVRIPGAGLIAFVIVTVLVGWAVRQYIGKRLQQIVEAIINRLPGVSKVYNMAKEACTAIFGGDKNAFQYVAVIEFCGQRMLGFVTGEVPNSIGDEVNRQQNGLHLGQMYDASSDTKAEKILSVFVVHAFSPGTGYIVLMPQSKVRKIDISVEQALKFSITAGMVKGEANG